MPKSLKQISHLKTKLKIMSKLPFSIKKGQINRGYNYIYYKSSQFKACFGVQSFIGTLKKSFGSLWHIRSKGLLKGHCLPLSRTFFVTYVSFYWWLWVFSRKAELVPHWKSAKVVEKFKLRSSCQICCNLNLLQCLNFCLLFFDAFQIKSRKAL